VIQPQLLAEHLQPSPRQAMYRAFTAVLERAERRIAPGDPNQMGTAPIQARTLEGKTHVKCQTRSRRRIAVMAVGVLAAGVVAVPALAIQTVRNDSRVIWSGPNRPSFSGRVKSSRHACEFNRYVKLLMVRSGPDELLGKDRTNRRGQWTVRHPIEPGRFYAKVVRRKERTAGTIFVCRRDRSTVISFH